MTTNARAARAIFLLSASAMAFGMPATAQAQDDMTGASSADIVVTARRREEKLQDVPIAVTAISQAGLDSRGFDAVTDVQQIAPNLNFTPGQGGNSGGIAAFIRGVGENDFIITSDPAVGLYMDGVYIARTFGATTELLGIDRIEVLRGPQGTLFGKNTIGGAINVVSGVPDGSDVLEADLRYGSYNTVRARTNVEGALTDKLSLGISVLGEFGEGWQKVPSGKNLGNKRMVAGRVTLHYDDGPFDAVLTVDGLHRNQNSTAHSMLAFTPTPLSDLQNLLLGPCCTVPGRIDRTDTTQSLNHDDTDSANAALTLSYDVGAGTIKSITAYRWVSALFGRDGDASSAVNYAGDIHDEGAKQFSQELQYTTPLFGDRGNLLVGAYYFRERTRDDTRLVVADGLYPAMIAAGFDPALATALDLNIDFFNRQKTTNYAAFGNFTYDLTDALTVEVGGRYTYEKKTFTQRSLRIYSQQPLIPGFYPYTLSEDWDAFSPRASVSYKFDSNVLGYASWSRGFRSGGFNGRPTAEIEIGSYDPEYLTAYEVGLKSTLGPVLLNIAAFRNEYKDQQLLVNKTNLNVGYENAGKSRIQGLELELSARVTPRFQISGSLGLLDAKYLEFETVINGQPVDLTDRKLKQAPEITGNLSLVYTAPITDELDATFRADTTYRSLTYIDVENSPLRAPDHAILNLSADFDLPWDGTSLRFAVDNVTDKQVVTAGFDGRASFGFMEGFFSDPRRYSVTLSIRR
ncbi:iron complex outermembrane recepter protein [Sphingomonas laterariae]|uniref:Iron complex outermembrane recepter protein n=1 Tax=Edaphosphingomonas laterariae TaxID=861865 RepID=A0A239BHJ4_9SPHN|nr:TonB-dependent receptor [Sphingomonas laterariae]SNS07575.1 iron complex outermembrane recepter protein [Sphingomonas laterariae]